MARAGFSWLTVDVEHTLVSWETTAHMIGAIADAGCVPLVRVPANRHDHIKRALDNGAFGVVVPMVNSREEAEQAVSAMLYPPTGTRSVGGNLHALNFAGTPAEYFKNANGELLVVLQCEHIQAVRDADQIFSVKGIDAIFVGPNDLAASMRSADGKPPGAEEFSAALADILAACKRHGVAAGIHCMNPLEAKTRIQEGWQFIAINSELKMMMEGVANTLKEIDYSTSTAESAKY